MCFFLSSLPWLWAVRGREGRSSSSCPEKKKEKKEKKNADGWTDNAIEIENCLVLFFNFLFSDVEFPLPSDFDVPE